MTTTLTTPDAIADLTKRLWNPVFGTETTERNLFNASADMITALAARLTDVEAENANLEAAIKRQAGAAHTLRSSIMTEVQNTNAHLSAIDRSEYCAAATVDSERLANSILTEELTRAEAERDTALAQVAVAYDVEAVACAIYSARGSAPYAWSDMTNGMKAPTREQAASVIRALTPALATAALTAMLDRARGATIEAARNIAIKYHEDSISWAKKVYPDIDMSNGTDSLRISEDIDALHTPASRVAVKGGA